MGKHSKPHRSWGPYVTTGIALEAAAIFGFAYASDSHVSPPNLLAATIFVDGTKSITGSEEGVPFFRMADSFQSAYDLPGFDKVFIEYPRSLGPLTGQGDPTYDDSEADATAKIVTAVQQARKDDKTGKIYVVGYSQGSGAAAKALEELESEGFDTDNIEFVLAANPRRNDGGILTRLPKGVYLPVFGVTFGDGTSPERTDVLQVTKMYDGVGDSPDYIFSLVPPPDKWLSDVQSVGAWCRANVAEACSHRSAESDCEQTSFDVGDRKPQQQRTACADVGTERQRGRGGLPAAARRGPEARSVNGEAGHRHRAQQSRSSAAAQGRLEAG